MNKYKDTYKIKKELDKSGKPSLNKQDTYIPCKRTKNQIYRYDKDTLVVYFHSKIYTKNRLTELTELGIELIPYQIGDNESTYKFAETDLDKVAEIIKAKKRVKRDLSEEDRNILRERMIKAREKMLSNKNDSLKD